jgi:hypothetical protein
LRRRRSWRGPFDHEDLKDTLFQLETSKKVNKILQEIAWEAVKGEPTSGVQK